MFLDFVKIQRLNNIFLHILEKNHIIVPTVIVHLVKVMSYEHISVVISVIIRINVNSVRVIFDFIENYVLMNNTIILARKKYLPMCNRLMIIIPAMKMKAKNKNEIFNLEHKFLFSFYILEDF